MSPPRPDPGSDDPAHKAAPSKSARFLRLVLAALDPRAWAHAVKIVNYYNYTHVVPLRAIRPGAGSWIAPNSSFSNPERITIGRKVGIGARTTLWAGPSRGRIVIGDNALFAPDVFVTAAGYRFDDGAPVSDQAMDEADVIIGEDVWIGTHVVILPGVTVGAGAVVAAGAVVNRDVAPGDIVAGVPARKVGRRSLHG